MNLPNRTLEEVRSEGYSALVQALGPSDFIRFLHMNDNGEGDYTASRDSLVEKESVEAIAARILKRQTS